MHKNRPSKKAFKTTGVTSGKLTVACTFEEAVRDIFVYGESVMMAADRVNKNLNSFSGVSMRATVEKNTECTVCGNLNCEHLMAPNMEVGNDKDTTRKGNIEFFVEGVPVLELCENGDIKVKGKLIENDAEVVEGLRLFLRNAKPSVFQNCPKCGADLTSSLLFYAPDLGEEF